MSMIYGVGNVAQEETCNLNMLILSAATPAVQIKTLWGGGLSLRRMCGPWTFPLADSMLAPSG